MRFMRPKYAQAMIMCDALPMALTLTKAFDVEIQPLIEGFDRLAAQVAKDR